MAEQRVARGSLNGAWRPRTVDRRPNLHGSITVESDIAAGQRLWVSGWTKKACGVEYVSLSVEVAGKGGRRRRRRGADPEGRFRDVT